MAYDGQLSSTQDGFTATRPASRHIKGATLASRLPAWVLERARANGGFEMPVTETSTGNAGNRTADAIVEEATRAMMKDNERWKQASTKSIATGMTTHAAARRGRLDVLEQLMLHEKEKADPNERDAEGMTPVSTASKQTQEATQQSPCSLYENCGFLCLSSGRNPKPVLQVSQQAQLESTCSSAASGNESKGIVTVLVVE
eukprot:1690173-Rhodomonas_salina.1